MKLRKYQTNIIKNIVQNFKTGYKKLCVILSCGGGKSVIAGHIARKTTDKGNRVLFIVHRRELCSQIKGTFKKMGVDMNLCNIGMVQTISKRIEQEPEPKLIITDECIPADSLILTPRGAKQINHISVGDYVLSFNHKTNKVEPKKVLRTFKSYSETITEVSLSNGINIYLTAGHPLYVDARGYISASKLNPGDVLYKFKIWKSNRGETELQKIAVSRAETIEFNEYVYNIEVEDNNNYLYEGILVHNCHHATASTYQKIYNKFPDAFHIGFSATPSRMGGEGLNEVYQKIIESVSTKWLIENKFLSPYKYYSVPFDDFKDIKIVRGDYDKKKVNDILEDKIIYGDTIKNYKLLANGKKTIVYCNSVEASKQTAAEFKAAGFKVSSLDGQSNKKDRDKVMEQFRNNEINILCNMNLFGEG